MTTPSFTHLPAHLPPRAAARLCAWMAGACLALAPLAAAAGSVEVNYVKPTEFADAGRSAIDREETLQTLTRHFTELAQQLPANQTLRLEVLDVDLAGELWPVRGQEIRILRNRADWPRITLRYTLLEDGRTLKAGEARLADMGYGFFPGTPAQRERPLHFEQRMLARWFDETFGSAR